MTAEKAPETKIPNPEQLKLITETAASAAVKATMASIMELETEPKKRSAKRTHSASGLPVGFADVDTSREATEKFKSKNHGHDYNPNNDLDGGPRGIRVLTPAPTRRELVYKKIQESEPVDGEASEINTAFAGLKKFIVEKRLSRHQKKAYRHAEDSLVLANADKAIRQRQGYTGIAFQGFDIPLRPSTHFQKKKARKLNDSIDQNRADIRRKKHYVDSYGEAILQNDYHETLRDDGATNHAERRDAWRANKAARQISKKIEKSESRRESILKKPEQKLKKSSGKIGELSTKRDLLDKAVNEKRERRAERINKAKEFTKEKVTAGKEISKEVALASGRIAVKSAVLTGKAAKAGSIATARGVVFVGQKAGYAAKVASDHTRERIPGGGWADLAETIEREKTK